MARKSSDEKLEEITIKMKQLEARKREIQKRKSAEDRKKRTKRLIELGGIVEAVLGRDTTEDDKVRLSNFLKKQEKNGKYFSKAMNSPVVQKTKLDM